MGWDMCCGRSTNLEKTLIVSVVLLSCAVVVLFVFLMLSAHENGVCHSPQCVRAAHHILDTIDPSVDPCDDFYKFACGSFLKNAFSLGQTTTLHSLLALKKNRLKEIVMETTNETRLPKTLALQRRFYTACTNDSAIDEDNDKTFLEALDDVVGGWPVVKGLKWNERNFEWSKSMVKAKRLGFPYQFFFRISLYLEDTFFLWIRPPSKADVSSYHWKEQNKPVIAEIASILASRNVGTSDDLRRTMDFARQLEKTLEKYYNKTAEDKTSTSRNSTIKNLKHIFIRINWMEFLTNISGVALKEEDLVIFDVDEYFEDLYYLLLQTPKKIQANYIAWAIISTNVNYMTKKIRDKYRQILKFSNNTAADQSRSDTCFELSTTLFAHVAEGEYIRRYTPPGKRSYIRDMIANIKKEVEIALQENSWMDRKTKKYTMKHLRNYTESIGWTDIVYDVEKFDKLFGHDKLRITSNNLMAMKRELGVNGVNTYYQQMTLNATEVDQLHLHTPSLVINAYYLEYYNRMMLPAPILQGLVFDDKRPHYMNYGSLGTIIGHEFTHGFMGYAKDDDLARESWWTNKTRENFKNVSECLVVEYQNYTHQTGDVNKNATIFEENLADFTGLNLAYTAYQKWVRNNDYEGNLPGISYTPNQIFWIMASTYLCQEPRLAEKDEIMKKNVLHALPSFRVIGRVRNSPYFAKDFNCPLGSKMNPKKKCRIFA